METNVARYPSPTIEGEYGRKTKGKLTKNASNKKSKFIANVKPCKFPPKSDVTSVCNVEKKVQVK